MQRRLIQTKVYHFFTLSEKKRLTNLEKVAVVEKPFPSVYIMDTTCFDEYVFYPVWWLEDILFCTNLSLPRNLVKPPCRCALWNKYFEKGPYFIFIYSHNNITMLLIPQCSYFLQVLNKIHFFDSYFLFFQLVNVRSECSTFFFINEIFKT